MKAYQSQVRRKLERNKKYPQYAQARKITGVATLSFTIHRSGSVSGAKLANSSGHAILDDEVRALLQRAAPMPPIPPEISANTLSLSIPIRFSVR
jgi:protein TonB